MDELLLADGVIELLEVIADAGGEGRAPAFADLLCGLDPHHARAGRKTLEALIDYGYVSCTSPSLCRRRGLLRITDRGCAALAASWD